MGEKKTSKGNEAHHRKFCGSACQLLTRVSKRKDGQPHGRPSFKSQRKEGQGGEIARSSLSIFLTENANQHHRSSVQGGRKSRHEPRIRSIHPSLNHRMQSKRENRIYALVHRISISRPPVLKDSLKGKWVFRLDLGVTRSALRRVAERGAGPWTDASGSVETGKTKGVQREQAKGRDAACRFGKEQSFI